MSKTENTNVYVVFKNTINEECFWQEVSYGDWVRMFLMKNGIPENCEIKNHFSTQKEAEDCIAKVV